MTTMIKLSTNKSLGEVKTALQAVVPANRFDITQVFNIRKLTKKGVQFATGCVIFEIRKAHQKGDAPEDARNRLGTSPCCISIYVKGEKTMLAALKPTSLLALFSAPQLVRVARDVEASMLKIMHEAARGDHGQRVPA